MPVLPRNVLLHGREAPPAERMRLHAGLLRMDLEPETAFLRYVRLGDREIVRGIYAAVRDQHWRTIVPSVSNLQVERDEYRFRITFDADCHEREIHFTWRGTITGTADEQVTFTMDGVARSTFLRNRIGICVLHPIEECAGQPCTVERDDGSIQEGQFPHHIKPHQPFTDLRAITHEVRPGIRAEVRFEGDVFEMEDQRNWTDSSFKTYSGPLSRPIPVEVEEGARISQSVTIRLHGDVPARPPAAPADADEVVFRASREPPIPLPRIGLGVASHGQPLSPTEIERLKALHLAHLRVDLRLAESTYQEELAKAARESQTLDVPLEVAVFLTDAAEDELRGLAAELERMQPRVSHWLIFHEEEASTTERWVQVARQHLAPHDPEAKIGAGSDANFTELNRERPPVEALDLVCYSVNPQVHTFDSASLIESLRTQAWTVQSARQFVGDLPIAVTPVTLKRRSNPHLTEAEMQPDPTRLPTPVDVRQISLFGAAWTLGSIKYLAEGRASGVTYYETTGWRGVMETEDGSPLPEEFPAIPGAVFPLYHVLADVAEFAGGKVIASLSRAPLRVDGLVLEKSGRRCVLLANMRPEPQKVTVGGFGLGDRVRVRHLDETNAEHAMREPEAFRRSPGAFRYEPRGGVIAAPQDRVMLSLRPYAYVRISAERRRAAGENIRPGE